MPKTMRQLELEELEYRLALDGYLERNGEDECLTPDEVQRLETLEEIEDFLDHHCPLEGGYHA